MSEPIMQFWPTITREEFLRVNEEWLKRIDMGFLDAVIRKVRKRWRGIDKEIYKMRGLTAKPNRHETLREIWGILRSGNHVAIRLNYLGDYIDAWDECSDSNTGLQPAEDCICETLGPDPKLKLRELKYRIAALAIQGMQEDRENKESLEHPG